jgi:hypothetical protein
MSTSVLVAKERQPGSLFGLGQKQAKKQKAKKYGANAPQLHAIRCSIGFCVMLCNETAFNPLQTWLSAFAAMCRSTTVGMASGNKYELHQMFGSKPRWTPWSDWEDMA